MTYDLPATRAIAEAAGFKKFFTGKPCKNGHTVYRYTQSGTCSGCIRAAVDGTKVAARDTLTDAGAQRAARIAAFEQLAEVKVRARPETIAQLRALAGFMVTARFPELAKTDAWSPKSGTDGAAGTLLYKFNLHHDDINFIRAEAARTLNPEPVDIDAARRRIFGLAALPTPEELDNEPPFKP